MKAKYKSMDMNNDFNLKYGNKVKAYIRRQREKNLFSI